MSAANSDRVCTGEAMDLAKRKLRNTDNRIAPAITAISIQPTSVSNDISEVTST